MGATPSAFRQTLHLAILIAAALAPAGSLAGEACAGNIQELRALAGETIHSLRWLETSMGDGKPLSVSIAEQDGQLLGPGGQVGGPQAERGIRRAVALRQEVQW